MVKIYSSTITNATDVATALSDDDYAIDRAQITMLRGDDVRGVISINACFYLLEADLTTATEFLLGTIDEAMVRPNSYIIIPGVEVITASLFHDQTNAPFAGVQVLDKCTVSISPNGGIYVRINTVTTPATLGGNDYVIIPVVVSFTKVIPEVVNNS